jgi:hypothetical protein
MAKKHAKYMKRKSEQEDGLAICNLCGSTTNVRFVERLEMNLCKYCQESVEIDRED